MKSIIAAAVVAVGASPAMAGDFGDAAVMQTVLASNFDTPERTGDWTGAYVGLQASVVEGTSSLDPGADVFDFSGGLYGLHVGYDFDFGRFVFGGELEYDQGNVGSELRPAFGGGDAGIILDWVARLKLRAGYDLGRTLIYATGGAARASASAVPGPLGTSASSPGRMDGYFLGAGINYLVAENITLGAEVLMHRFGDFENSPFTDTETDLTSISLRLEYRF